MNIARSVCLLGSLSLLSLLPASLRAEDAKKTPAPPPQPRRRENPTVSPEVNPDHTITFRLKAPAAQKVSVTLAIPKDGNLPMTQGDNGVWSVTTPVMDPEIYEYGLVVDGVRIVDPGNRYIKPGRDSNTSIVQIPASPAAPWDWTDVPHGAVTVHAYNSKAVGRVRRVLVYTPPGYLKDTSGTKYPTLYLFHGSGDNEGCWAELGKAPLILDNLIAQGKAKPMLIVMPDGHAIPQGGVPAGNLAAFEKDLLDDVMLLVESNYRAIPDADHRAIIGLSMGGGQSLTIGINHADTFAWIGGMSAYVPNAEQTIGPAVTAPGFNDKVKLLWFAIGKEDFLLKGNQEMDAFLTGKNVKHQFVLTEGSHRWPVWRHYLVDFVPLIFK
jgi:enterochelin esterase family protein